MRHDQLLMIGLKGDRQVGKSRFAEYLVEEHGFRLAHPFDGGKAASRGYFMHLGAGPEMATRMTDGDLKDVPCSLLPVIVDPAHGRPGEHYAPRFFMEKLARCMGVDMGSDFTLGMEMERAMRDPGPRPTGIIFSSIVFEADVFRRKGGVIIEITRKLDKHAGRSVGIETDGFSAGIVPDMIFDNSFDTLREMREAADHLLFEEFRIGTPENEPEPFT